MKVSIVGAGGIGYASAAWLAQGNHSVTIWAPRTDSAAALREAPLLTSGVLQTEVRITIANNPQTLCADAAVILIAIPVNGHRAIMDSLLPYLQNGQTVLISSMSSLSALYLAEAAQVRGIDLIVAALGTTVLTARRDGPSSVRIMTRRTQLGVSALPCTRIDSVLALCRELFGDVFSKQANVLASTLTNINPVAHGPLALFNWTRIERAENWPQYHYMTPDVAAVIERLDAERLALAVAFGVQVRSIEQHFAQSFATSAEHLADIATELHAKRGGPPGPTDTQTRFLHEDIPYGLAFYETLGQIAGVSMPATQAVIEMASLITRQDLRNSNDLLAPLQLKAETLAGLLARVN